MKKKHPIDIHLLLPFFFFLLISPQSAFGETMSGDAFRLEIKPQFSGDPTFTPTPAPLSKDITIKLLRPAVIKTYGESEILASQSFISFGPLTPTDPTIRKLHFSISGKNISFNFYQNPDDILKNQSGEAIPPTSCDDGTCTSSRASPWINTLTYGFGMRCDNMYSTACADDFIERQSFRSVDRSNGTPSSIVASGVLVNRPLKIDLTYKINIQRAQTPGLYLDSITYMLIPML